MLLTYMSNRLSNIHPLHHGTMNRNIHHMLNQTNGMNQTNRTTSTTSPMMRTRDIKHSSIIRRSNAEISLNLRMNHAHLQSMLDLWSRPAMDVGLHSRHGIVCIPIFRNVHAHRNQSLLPLLLMTQLLSVSLNLLTSQPGSLESVPGVALPRRSELTAHQNTMRYASIQAAPLPLEIQSSSKHYLA